MKVMEMCELCDGYVDRLLCRYKGKTETLKNVLWSTAATFLLSIGCVLVWWVMTLFWCFLLNGVTLLDIFELKLAEKFCPLAASLHEFIH